MEACKTDNKIIINKLLKFLDSIDIEIIENEFEEKTFLPGLKIENGCLMIDRQRLLYPGDILHEAGHIAVVPQIERGILNDNVTVNRPGADGEEMAVMLWSYAACLHIGINPEIVFHKDGYKGSSEWILNNYNEKKYIGLPLLVWMGLASDQSDANRFPKMIKWLRD